MNLATLPREQKMMAAAGACVLSLIALFLPWVSIGDLSASATDLVPSFWILLIFTIVAAGVFLAEAFNVALPALPVHPLGLAAFLMAFYFILTVMYLLEGNGLAWGFFLALIFSGVAAVASALIWRQEGK